MPFEVRLRLPAAALVQRLLEHLLLEPLHQRKYRA